MKHFLKHHTTTGLLEGPVHSEVLLQPFIQEEMTRFCSCITLLSNHLLLLRHASLCIWRFLGQHYTSLCPGSYSSTTKRCIVASACSSTRVEKALKSTEQTQVTDKNRVMSLLVRIVSKDTLVCFRHSPSVTGISRSHWLSRRRLLRYSSALYSLVSCGLSFYFRTRSCMA